MGGGSLMNDAGKVAFTPKGEYSSTTPYEPLDNVVYNGNSYVALKSTTGNAPTDSDTDEYWKLFARGGESVPLASENTPGVVKASGDISVSDDGSMSLKTDFTEQETLESLTGEENRTTFFGKISKAVSTLISHISTSATSEKLGHVKVTNSSSVTDSTGLALSATEKNASIEGSLANQISNVDAKADAINTNLSIKTGGTITNISSSFVDIALAKVANIKVLDCTIVFPSTITAWQFTVLGQINETEYRPIYGFSQHILAWDTATGLSTLVMININPEGQIKMYCTDKTNLEGLRTNLHLVYI